MSAINDIDGRKIPVFIAFAELDMPMVQNQNLSLINALYKRDKLLPTVKQVLGHNHMSIVKHIMNRHDGKLEIESAINEGSKFTCVFPKT